LFTRNTTLSCRQAAILNQMKDCRAISVRLHSVPIGTLYYGDNLDILRRCVKDESVDLVHLDLRFNSAQNYNAFFQEKEGAVAVDETFKEAPKVREMEI